MIDQGLAQNKISEKEFNSLLVNVKRVEVKHQFEKRNISFYQIIIAKEMK